MFVLILTYVKPVEDVDCVLDRHIEFLNTYYSMGKFICSGRQVPRTGGVILCNATDRAEVEAIVREDPFDQAGVAKYTIIEFSPTKYAEGFEKFVISQA